MKVTLVAGPPCAGKTTYIRAHMNPGDLMLDRDSLEEALTGAPADPRETEYGPYIAAAFYAILAKSRAQFLSPHTLWVQECAPLREARRRYRKMNGARVILLETPAQVCNERAMERYGPGEKLDAYLAAIDQWWTDYQRDRPFEEVISEPEVLKGSHARAPGRHGVSAGSPRQ